MTIKLDGTAATDEQKAGIRADLGLVTTVDDSLGIPILDPAYLDSVRVNQRLRWALRRVEIGERDSIRMMCIGDSLSGPAWVTTGTNVSALLTAYLQSDVYYHFYDPSGKALGPSASTGQKVDGTATRTEKSDFNLSWVGNQTTHESGETSIWANGGNAVFCDRVVIPILTASGAGSVKIEISDGYAVSGATYRDVLDSEITSSHTLTGDELIVDANGSAGIDIVILEPSLGQHTIRITQVSGGDVLVLDIMMEVRNAAAVNLYNVGSGGHAIGDNVSAASSNMTALIDVIDPDIIFIEADDNLAAYQTFLPLLSTVIDSLATDNKPTVVLVGNPGIGSGFGSTQASLADRIAYCKQYALPRRWDVIDGLALFGGIEQLRAISWANDEVHLTYEVWRIMAITWFLSRGYTRVRQTRPGGDIATRVNILKGTLDKEVTSNNLSALLCNPQVDLGYATWSYLVTGTGAGSRLASSISLSTGATASSTVVAYVNESESAGSRSLAKSGGYSLRMRIASNLSADSSCWFALGASGRAYDAAYAGELALDGIAFVIDSTNQISGATWYGGALITTSPVTLTLGEWVQLVVLLNASSINSSNGTAEFYVNNVLIGTLNYSHVFTSAPSPRVEFTNGSDASNNVIDFLPPHIIELK